MAFRDLRGCPTVIGSAANQGGRMALKAEATNHLAGSDRALD